MPGAMMDLFETDPLITDANEAIARAVAWATEAYVGRDVIRLSGTTFKGRRCKIEGITVWCPVRGTHQLAFLARPYRLAGNGDVLLNDPDEARFYLPAGDLELCP